MTDTSDKRRTYTREHGFNSCHSTWSADRVESLKTLWAAGNSASFIADRLGGGVTRNAVIAKIHRLGLSGRTTTSHAPRRKRVSPLQKAHREKLGKSFFGPRERQMDVALPPPHETDVARISFIDLEDHHCRFVALEQPAGPYVKQFCGAEREPGVAYCSQHQARAYDQQPPRQRSKPQPILLVPTFEIYVKEDA